MKHYIDECVEFQESIGLDVLVHGEPERNDMVEYFGEQLKGYCFTSNGWVQSYGTRCVKPPIIYGDVSRPAPMTVDWITYAQSLTKKPMKGMLTGPVTILCWSFVRDDMPRGIGDYLIGFCIITLTDQALRWIPLGRVRRQLGDDIEQLRHAGAGTRRNETDRDQVTFTQCLFERRVQLLGRHEVQRARDPSIVGLGVDRLGPARSRAGGRDDGVRRQRQAEVEATAAKLHERDPGMARQHLTEYSVAAGEHVTRWDGTDAAGRAVSSGSYVFRLQADGLDVSRKCSLLK